MSGSIHITIKNFKKLTKKEIAEQASDPTSDLTQWNKKSTLKKEVKKKRKDDKK